MKTQYTLQYLLIALLMSYNLLMGDKSRVPSQVSLSLDTTQRSSMTTLTIQCTIYVAIKEGLFTLELRDGKNAVIEKTILWQEKSDTAVYKKFVRNLRLDEGEKLSVYTNLDYSMNDGMKCGDGANLFIYRHPTKGFLTHPTSFYELDERETWKDAWAKGYRGMSVEEITKKDPELGKRFERFYNAKMQLGPGSANPHPKPKPTEYSEPVYKPKPNDQAGDSSSSPKNQYLEKRKQNDPVPYETYKAWQKTNNVVKQNQDILPTEAEQHKPRPSSNLTHEDSVKIQQAVPGIKGDKAKQPPDLNEIDTIGIRMKRESR